MSTVRNIDDIHVLPGRIRTQFEPRALEELVQSILTDGLLHPIVVRDEPVDIQGKPRHILLAGERRYRALQIIAERGLSHVCDKKTLAPGLIITTSFKAIDEARALSIEIAENSVRVDIPWQEAARAIARLAELRQRLQQIQQNPDIEIDAISPAELDITQPPAPEIITQIAAETTGKDEAALNRTDLTRTQDQILVARWLDAFPQHTEIARAVSLSEALKLITLRLEERQRARRTADFLHTTDKNTPHRVLKEDLTTTLPLLPNDLIDCWVIDPPWGVNATSWAAQNATRQHSYQDDPATAQAILQVIKQHCYRVSKTTAHLYLFCAVDKFLYTSEQLRQAGWTVWPRPFIWHRGNSGIMPRPDYGPRYTYEFIIFANKGDRKVVEAGNDVLLIPKDGSDERAAEKPAQVYWELLRRSVLPGDTVCDPCCGAGGILPAANALHVKALCMDIDPVAIGLAITKINQPLTRQTFTIARGTKVRHATPATFSMLRSDKEP